MELPGLYNLDQPKNKIASLIGNHKILFLASLVLSVTASTFGIQSILGKENTKANTQVAQMIPSPTENVTPTIEASGSGSITPTIADSSVLGDTIPEDIPDYSSYPTITPFPLMTLVPIPTFAQNPTPPPAGGSPTPTPTSCNRIPTAYNSQAYVSSSVSLVNSQVTISIELKDCNNALTSVNDSLTIALVNADSGLDINGYPPPQTVQAQNGKATFYVNSSNAITDTFVITNTTRSFTVTDPKNHNPSVTFWNNTSGNANCTTPGGIANAWFSDVYPASPVTIAVGSAVTYTVVIRDCNKNTVGGNETVRISLSSGDSTTQANGNNFPYSVTTQNGQVTFTIISQHAGTNSFVIQDTTGSFTITDTNNHNPSVIFTSTATPTPTSTPAGGSPTPTTAGSPTNTPTATTTAGPTSTPGVTSTPTTTPTPTTAGSPSPTSGN